MDTVLFRDLDMIISQLENDHISFWDFTLNGLASKRSVLFKDEIRAFV